MRSIARLERSFDKEVQAFILNKGDATEVQAAAATTTMSPSTTSEH